MSRLMGPGIGDTVNVWHLDQDPGLITLTIEMFVQTKPNLL